MYTGPATIFAGLATIYPRPALIRLSLFFVSFLQKRNVSIEFRVSYLHSEVEWSIKTEFVTENLYIYEL